MGTVLISDRAVTRVAPGPIGVHILGVSAVVDIGVLVSLLPAPALVICMNVGRLLVPRLTNPPIRGVANLAPVVSTFQSGPTVTWWATF